MPTGLHRRERGIAGALRRLGECETPAALAAWLATFVEELGLSGGCYAHLGHVPAADRARPDRCPVRWLATGTVGAVAEPDFLGAIGVDDNFLPFRWPSEPARRVWLVVPVQDHGGGPAWLGFFGGEARVTRFLGGHPADLAFAGAQFHALARRLLPAGTGTPLKGLTDREIECLRRAALGWTLVRIGELLHIAGRTVEFHLTNAARKLGATNRVHAVAIAAAGGLIHI